LLESIVANIDGIFSRGQLYETKDSQVTKRLLGDSFQCHPSEFMGWPSELGWSAGVSGADVGVKEVVLADALSPGLHQSIPAGLAGGLSLPP
jgi:hypothetical protein